MDEKTNTEILKKDNLSIVSFDNNAYAFETVAATSSLNRYNFSNFGNSPKPARLNGNILVIPRGDDNLLPETVQLMIEDSNLAPGILNRKGKLLWGKGPALYKTDYVEGVKEQEFVEDTEALEWLESWGYEEYLQKIIIDFQTINGCYTKMIPNRVAFSPLAMATGQKRLINRLEYVMYSRCWVGWPDETTEMINNIFIQSRYNINGIVNYTPYPIYDNKDPFSEISLFWSHGLTFNRDFPLPEYWGTRNWIEVANMIPKMLKSLNNNMLTLKYHVKIPAAYWSNEENNLKEDAQRKGIPYASKMLEDKKDDLMTQFSNVLSGTEKVGKFLNSQYVVNKFGNIEDWKIESIDMKIRDYIMAQIAVSKRADTAGTSGFSLAHSLSNLKTEGNLSSGSEQLYALSIHNITEVNRDEMRVTAPVNHAIKANWPDRNIKLGFQRLSVKAEQEITPGERTINKS